MSTHSLKQEYELCRVGNCSHEHFKLRVDDTYVDNSSQVVSAWNPVRKYSAGTSHAGANLRLHLEELRAVMVCDLRLDVSGLTVLRAFSILQPGSLRIVHISPNSSCMVAVGDSLYHLSLHRTGGISSH